MFRGIRDVVIELQKPSILSQLSHLIIYMYYSRVLNIVQEILGRTSGLTILSDCKAVYNPAGGFLNPTYWPNRGVRISNQKICESEEFSQRICELRTLFNQIICRSSSCSTRGFASPRHFQPEQVSSLTILENHDFQLLVASISQEGLC